ncbi:anti-sigma factor family protein [Paractinoplanes globisporus]|uniref:Anti-sigma factor family protein n=1 Tax=Paractinoplanes globisporus TaxID=113565 RepID=A0ABW6WDW8_9ACTN|nr:zf-HC2 domain-containing protein [Actinoplanes globisporus]
MSEHETELLGAYVLGVLDRDEQAAVQTHLDGCAPCRREVDDLRQMEAALGEIPPEAFLEGPPPDGDLLLQRTLREVRRSGRREARRIRVFVIAAAVVAVVVALGAGAVIGRGTAPATQAAKASSPPGARTGSATNAATGVSMNATVRAAAGWVRVSATVTGVAAGEQCRLFVVARDGSREPAGSWLASPSGSTTLDGAALMAPGLVTAVQAETYAGQILVAVPI